MYFKELEYIKKDDIFWECTQQGNIQVKALEDAIPIHKPTKKSSCI